MPEVYDKPAWCRESGCPLAEIGKKFCLGTGDPRTAKIGILLEAPGGTEIQFEMAPDESSKLFSTKEECDAEIKIRKRDYPDLPERFIRNGAALVGASWSELWGWCLKIFGIKRADLFIDNTLRCLPPRQGDSNYPDGWIRKRAEAMCRHYDRWSEFRPDVNIISLHPASVLRTTTPLWLQVKNFEKARDFTKQGLKVMVLAGGKAVKWWLGYGENVTKFQGHYQLVNSAFWDRLAKRLDVYKLATPTKKKKGDKEVDEGARKYSRPAKATVESILGS